MSGKEPEPFGGIVRRQLESMGAIQAAPKVVNWPWTPTNCACGAGVQCGSRCATCDQAWLVEQHQARARADREDALKAIPRRFRWASFASSDLRQRVKDLRAIEAAQAAVGQSMVTLTGPSGAGKTTLASCMLRAAIDVDMAGSRPAFEDVFALAKARAQHGLGDGEAPLVETALAASLLVLDDVGSEPNGLHAKVVAEIIHERHAHERQTLVTTWLTPGQAVDRYGDGIARRLFEQAVIDVGAGRG